MNGIKATLELQTLCLHVSAVVSKLTGVVEHHLLSQIPHLSTFELENAAVRVTGA
jgi:hypothetical protein